MTAEAIVAALEMGDTEPLKANPGMAGTAEVYFLRVANLIATDPEGLKILGRSHKAMLRLADRPDFVWRARGGVLRSQGRWRASAEAFSRAGSLAATPVEKVTFKLGAIDSLARAGDLERAIRVGGTCVRALERLNEPGLAAKARLNLANAYIWNDRYRDALREYRRVLEHSLSSTEIAAAHLGVSTSLLFSGQISDVRHHASLALEAFEALGADHFAALARLNLGWVSILEGRPESAWRALRELEDELSETDDWKRVLELQADAALALNLLESAQQLYAEAGALQKGSLNAANCMFGEGQALLRQGEVDAALPKLKSASRHYKRIGNPTWSCLAAMEIAVATEDRRSLRQVAEQLRFLRAGYWEAVAQLHLARIGDGNGLTRAKTLVRRNGYLNLLWKVRWMDARESGSLAAYRRLAKTLVADRLISTSVAGRMGYLRDKQEAATEYLRLLLESGSPRDLKEAVDFIQQTRAAALFDELAGGTEFSRLRAQVDFVRQSLQDDSTGGSRGTRSTSAVSSFIGMTSELDRLLQPRSDTTSKPFEGDVWIDLGDELVSISEGAKRSFGAARIKSQLRWLWFELMAPLTDRNSPPEPATRLMNELRSQLGAISAWICPDGALWGAPWAALTDSEPTIALNPAFAGAPNWSLSPNSRVAIWFHEAQDLPAIRSEVDAVLKMFPDAVVCATREAALASMSESWDYVHVATHARVQPGNPMMSYFEFSDGPLYAIDITQSLMSVELAVLAACETGKLDTTLRDEPNGLVRAFLARGANSVIAGQWPLDDEAGALMMSHLVQHLAKGVPVVKSLHEARTKTRNAFPHPYFWAPLVHFAGYGARSREDLVPA